jgi:mono/diheme cytochrome c family protein
MKVDARRAFQAWVALLGAIAIAAATSAAAQEPSARRGGVIVKRHCGGCHAAGAAGASPFPAAPPLRELHRRYEPDVLAEALAEGLLTGHPAMPEFRFGPDDVRSIILYLNEIQDRQKS